jgi:putative membrane protein
MPYGYGPGVGWAGALFGLLLFLVFIAVIAWVILTVVSQRSHHHRHMHEWGPGPVEASSDALKILNERFARGEISADEYTERRDLLKGSS